MVLWILGRVWIHWINWVCLWSRGILEYNNVCRVFQNPLPDRFIESMYQGITYQNDDDDVCMGGPPLFVYSQIYYRFYTFFRKALWRKKKLLNWKRAENKWKNQLGYMNYNPDEFKIITITISRNHMEYLRLQRRSLPHSEAQLKFDGQRVLTGHAI